MKKILFFAFLFLVSFLWACKPKNQDVVNPTKEIKTVLAQKTIIMEESQLNQIISVTGNEIVFKTPKNGRTNDASFGVGTNLITLPNARFPDGLGLKLVGVTANGNGTSTAQHQKCQIEEVCESLNEKAIATIGPSTISKIYKANGDELPYHVNGDVGLVPINFTFPLKDNADKPFGEVNINGSIELSGSVEFAIVSNKNTRYFLSKTSIQDKEKLTATFTTGGEKKK